MTKAEEAFASKQIQHYRKALLRIVDEFKGFEEDDLTKSEREVIWIAKEALKGEILEIS